MKKIFTLQFIGGLALFFLFAINASAQPSGTVYSTTLYRVNPGGTTVSSIDTSKVAWGNDHPDAPSLYVDTAIAGNRTYTVYDTILFDASVPVSVPVKVFKSERSLSEFKGGTELEWKFPVKATSLVEVRLYFAELYFNEPGVRVFDIWVEGEKVLSNFDIFSEVGKFTGVAKTFVAEVGDDDTLNIVFAKNVGQPKINGIEIIEVTPTVQSVFGKRTQNTIAAFPNPCKDVVTLKLDNSAVRDLQLFDSYGKQIDNPKAEFSGNDLRVDLSSQPSGVYMLKVTNDKASETLRLIKQ
ncbi:malectin domain-containing carbohydrate-binding protein [Sporocytophaga myxococcoides]|uniref:malectin domain-containing carbohydrate-binding protein n=1 Tax=Sporocytophaga myxococcoides TaxID=153721 RepID=UPI00042102B4|nr:malectin domain-containing carbohydrate-binding protein [Sporocytophaga myxococcoides]